LGLISIGVLAALLVLIAAGRVLFVYWINTSDPNPSPAERVAAQHASYISERYPSRGTAKAVAPCQPEEGRRSFHGAPIYICGAVQGTGEASSFYLDCVASTRAGVVIIGGLPASTVEKLRRMTVLSQFHRCGP
jgi:hypothetical protein